MKFELFDLERNQSLFENEVDYNLSESGVHPLKLSEILTDDELKKEAKNESKNDTISAIVKSLKSLASLVPGQD